MGEMRLSCPKQLGQVPHLVNGRASTSPEVEWPKVAWNHEYEGGKERSVQNQSLPDSHKAGMPQYFPALEVRKLWADFLLGAFSLRAVTFISHRASFFCLCAQFAMPAECPTAGPEGR